MKTFPKMLLALAALVIGGQYDLVFMPDACMKPLVEIKGAVVEESGKNILVFSRESDRYIWKKKQNLFRNGVDMGNYPLLQFQKSFAVEFPENPEWDKKPQ